MALNGRVGFRRSAHGEQNGLSPTIDAASGGDFNCRLATGANRHDALQALALIFFFFSAFLRGKFGWFGFRRKRVQVVNVSDLKKILCRPLRGFRLARNWSGLLRDLLRRLRGLLGHS